MATLATPGVAATPNVPAADDTMEISSDAGRLDQDIDIDFMGSENGDEDVDWMLQDATSERGNPQAQPDELHNDDLMYDDGEELAYVEEEAMQDDGNSYSEAQDGAADLDIEFDPHPATEETLYDATQDLELEPEQGYEQPEEETLIDFETFSEHGEAPVGDEQTELPGEVTATFDEGTFEEQLTSLDDLAFPGEAASYQEGTAWNQGEERTANDVSVPNDGENVEAQEDSNVGLVAGEQPSVPEASSRRNSLAPQDLTTAEDMPHEETTSLSQQEAVLTAGPVTSVVSPPATVLSTKAAVHPITVFYALEGFEYSLFPQSEHDDPNTYLLKDTSVASSTLADLFRACRSVLDQQVSDDVELEFYVESLHLTISEDSVHCRESSLAQIVDVYVDLVRNEGVEAVPALYMELNTKDRFSAQLTNLFKAASEKRGLYSLNIYQDEAKQQEEEVQAREEDEEQKQEEEQQPEREHTSAMQQSEPTYAEEEAKAEETAPADELSYGESGATVQEALENERTDAEESFVAASDPYDYATEQSTTQPAEDYEEETIGYQDENKGEEDRGQTDQGQDGEQEDVVEDAEQGDGSSSGSSTIQGENQPQSTHDDIDASSETAQARGEYVEQGEEETAANEHQQAEPEDFDGSFDAEESYELTEEQSAENYDDSAFATDNFNQEFDNRVDYTVDQDYHEDTQEGLDQPEDQHDWAEYETHHGEDAEPTQNSGTFQVPSSTEDEEDEITFNDDEFTFDDEQTQDVAVQEATTDSPLGKRGREDEDEGAIDGSDQESKRLKAS